jgi:hypothetical protein
MGWVETSEWELCHAEVLPSMLAGRLTMITAGLIGVTGRASAAQLDTRLSWRGQRHVAR